MVDFIKCIYTKTDWIPRKGTGFTETYDTATGKTISYDSKDIPIKVKVKYRNGIIEITLSGSVHKFYNSKHHKKGAINYDSFTLKKFIEALNMICEFLGMDPAYLYIQNLEIGVNITLPVNQSRVIDRIMTHKRELFDHMSIKKGNYVQAVHREFILKAYDKGAESKVKRNIFRFEIKFKRHGPLARLGIINLSDVAIPENWQKLQDLILQRWNECILPWNTNDYKYLSHEFWRYIIKEKHRNTYNDYFKKIEESEDKSGYNMKAIISELISMELCKLNGFKSLTLQSQLCKLNGLENSEEESKLCILNNHKRSIRTLTRCQVTGIDIRGQKKGSKFLNAGGLRSLKAKEPERFKELCKRLERSKFKNAPEGLKIRELAHNIRNEYYNRIHNTKRSIERVLTAPTGHLFDPLQYIAPEKLKIAGILKQI